MPLLFIIRSKILAVITSVALVAAEEDKVVVTKVGACPLDDAGLAGLDGCGIDEVQRQGAGLAVETGGAERLQFGRVKLRIYLLCTEAEGPAERVPRAVGIERAALKRECAHFPAIIIVEVVFVAVCIAQHEIAHWQEICGHVAVVRAVVHVGLGGDDRALHHYLPMAG